MTRHRLIVLTAALTLVAGLAVAANPHFLRATAALDGESLLVCWKEAGLGDTLAIDYTAAASAGAFYQCVNRGGNCPAAANKEEVQADVSASGTFTSGKNGQITACLTVQPPPATLDCPGNQVVELGRISYAGITLTDTTTPVSTATAPGTLTAVFFEECP